MHVLKNLMTKREFNKNTKAILEYLYYLRKEVEKDSSYRNYEKGILSKVLNYALKQNNKEISDYCLHYLDKIEKFHLKAVIYSKNIDLIKKVYGITESRTWGIGTLQLSSAINLMIKKRMEDEIIEFIDFILNKPIIVFFVDILDNIVQNLFKYKMDKVIIFLLSKNIYEKKMLDYIIEKLKEDENYLINNNLNKKELLNNLMIDFLNRANADEFFLKEFYIKHISNIELSIQMLQRYMSTKKISDINFFDIEILKTMKDSIYGIQVKEKNKKNPNLKTLQKIEKLVLKLELNSF